MGETSMIPTSGTECQAEGETKKLEVQEGHSPVCSGHIPVETGSLPVRVKTSDAQILVRTDVELLRRQQEVEEANKAIRQRLRG